jgi:Ala-tRNA(Pro) deacylase
MALNDRLKQCLEREAVAYRTVSHKEVFTAREVAAESHIADRRVAKVLAVRDDRDGHLMVVLPAACRLDLGALEGRAGRRALSLASEEEMGRLFPDCEVGAMPPFGHLYGMPVYIDACFPRAGDIAFPAGNHHEVVRMAYADYERVARPIAGEFCLHERDKDVSG